MNSTAVVAYLTLFAGTAFVFVFAALAFGRLVRPKVPSPRKKETYECGEPTIGSGFVQFDLRYYVIALLFIIFDVEAAFFFPWAVVFGTATRAAETSPPAANGHFSPAMSEAVASLGGRVAAESARATEGEAQAAMRDLARLAMADVAVFFGVLLVGFAYVWRQGDLDWVRAVSGSASTAAPDVTAIAAG